MGVSDETEKIRIATRRGLIDMSNGDEICVSHGQMIEKLDKKLEEMGKDVRLLPAMYKAICGGLDENGNPIIGLQQRVSKVEDDNKGLKTINKVIIGLYSTLFIAMVVYIMLPKG